MCSGGVVEYVQGFLGLVIGHGDSSCRLGLGQVVLQQHQQFSGCLQQQLLHERAVVGVGVAVAGELAGLLGLLLAEVRSGAGQ